MKPANVSSLVLRRPRGAGAAHLVLRVNSGQGGAALARLRELLREVQPASFGPDAPEPQRLQLGLGFSYRGLEALGVPGAYLRLFGRLAPAFSQGAPLRAARLGDAGSNGPARWQRGFQLDQAHVLLSLNGPPQAVRDLAGELARSWNDAHAPAGPLAAVDVRCGERLGAPPGEDGEWVHFGYRDGLTDHALEGVPYLGGAPGVSVHSAGEFVLGDVNDAGFNPFALSAAPLKVREFFHDASFGAYRPMRQDEAAFDAAVQQAVEQARSQIAQPVSPDWIKAKLCGRWPGGQALRPGQREPVRGDFALDFAGDDAGTGYPFAAHVRRMRPGTLDAHARARPLIRRGTPYGPARWQAQARDDDERGLLGLFFCASLEDQFEHLLGQWANRRPLGSTDPSTAQDPLAGAHEDPAARMCLPVGDGHRDVVLTGFAPWTRTLGTLYAWCPGHVGLTRLLEEDYVAVEDEGPWL